MKHWALAAALLVSASPLAAATHRIDPGEGAAERLQEALILAAPGDEIVLGEGRFVLTDGLSLDVDGVTVRGAGMAKTVLDFTTQQGAGEGLLVTSDNVTLRDFALENPKGDGIKSKGDGIKSKGADNIVYYRIRVTWAGGPLTTNGAYGLYPVESTGVLIDGCMVSGASDAGIYVGQSKDITVRYSVVEYNVAGIEIENSRRAFVHHNLATRNTGGILVFDLPGLPVMNGGNVVISDNLVVDNDTANFAPPGNIVAGVRRGTGIMVMANEDVVIEENWIDRNPTTAVMVISYPNTFNDVRYNPAPRDVQINRNVFGRNGYDPQIDGAPVLLAAFGGSLPPVMWDGLGKAPDAGSLDNRSGWTLGLPHQGAGFDQAKPGPIELGSSIKVGAIVRYGAPAELEARLK